MQIVDSYSEANRSTDITLDAWNFGIGQSFTGDGGILNNVRFYLSKFSTPIGNAVAKIYAHSGTFGTSSIPTGSPLATSGTFNVATLTTSPILIAFTFTGAEKITLTNATKYVVTIEYSDADGGGANWVNVGVDGTIPSHDGNFSGSADLSTWFADSGNDVCFYVYKDDVAGGVLTVDYEGGTPSGVVVTQI